MKKKEADNFLEKRDKAIEIGKLLPETKNKAKFYSEIIEAEKELIRSLKEESVGQNSIELAREKIEIINLVNSVIQKQKIYDWYAVRKAEYEKWLDESAVEVNATFDNLIKEARLIPYGSNPRLQDGISRFESCAETNTMEDKIQIFFFVKSELYNYYKNHPKLKILRNEVSEVKEIEASKESENVEN